MVMYKTVLVTYYKGPAFKTRLPEERYREGQKWHEDDDEEEEEEEEEEEKRRRRRNKQLLGDLKQTRVTVN